MRGPAGAWTSLQQTAMKAAQGRLIPSVRSWAINRIRDAGSPRDKLSQAQALYYALVREKLYVADPVDAEFIAGADCLLDQCGGLSLNGGDCDDLTVAMVAAFESVGLRACVVSHQYATEALEHVLSAVHDGARWYYADPSSGAPFGTARVPTREVWVAVPSLSVVCDKMGPCSPETISPLVEAGRPAGDFLGIGGVGASNNEATGATMSELQPVTGRALADLQRDFLVAYRALELERAAMVGEYKRMRAVREMTGKPPIDANVYAGPGQAVWGTEQEDKLRGLDQTAVVAIAYSRQGAVGQRRIERDVATGITGVVALDTEPVIYKESDGSVVLANVSATQQPQVTPAGFFSMGWPVVALVVGCTVAGVVATVALVSAAKDYIARVRAKDLQEHQTSLLQRGLSPEQVATMMRSLGETAERQAFAEAEKAKQDPLAQLATVAKWGGVGLLTFGALTGGIYLWSQLRSVRSSPRLLLAEAA